MSAHLPIAIQLRLTVGKHEALELETQFGAFEGRSKAVDDGSRLVRVDLPLTEADREALIRRLKRVLARMQGAQRIQGAQMDIAFGLRENEFARTYSVPHDLLVLAAEFAITCDVSIYPTDNDDAEP